MVSRVTPAEVQELIRAECADLAEMLCAKNRKYGNSALEPLRIFSRADPLAQLDVRIDDKLSRIAAGQPDDAEDAEQDLIGYLILKRVRARLALVAIALGDVTAEEDQPWMD
jgi:hypothetical protein